MKLRLLLMLIAGLGNLRAGSLQVDLSGASQTGAPGDLLAFFGTMTNVSPTDTIFPSFITNTALVSVVDASLTMVALVKA